ncbi:hypothetical protein GW17_00024444 [Ensete ventricosum]|nr:hypothetical protein GW17_00024444 [Ensete ventricosum]
MHVTLRVSNPQQGLRNFPSSGQETYRGEGKGSDGSASARDLHAPPPPCFFGSSHHSSTFSAGQQHLTRALPTPIPQAGSAGEGEPGRDGGGDGRRGKRDPPRSGSGRHHTCELRWVGPTRGAGRVRGVTRGGNTQRIIPFQFSSRVIQFEPLDSRSDYSPPSGTRGDPSFERRRIGTDEDDEVENSPGVRRELAKDVKSLPGWRKGVRQKKTKTRRKIIGGSRKACRELGIGLGLDDVVGPRHDFARRFAEGIGKLAGNTSIDHRKKTRRLFARIQEVVRLAGGLVFTQRRTVVDASVPQGGGLGSGHRCWETSARKLYIPIFQIRMEKMKEVKRPPL